MGSSHSASFMVCVHHFLVIALLAIVSVESFAQASLGVKGGALYVWNTSSIPVISGSDDCGTFSDGTSMGFLGGITGEYALFGDALELTGAVFYAMRPARLIVTSTDNFEVLDPRTNAYVSLEREHVFESNLGFVSVEAGFRTRPLPTIPIYVRAVFDAGNPIVDATYTQTEQIVQPEGVLFPDGTQKHVTASGEFPGLGTSYGVSGGLGAVLALSKNVELCPEVAYRYGLNSLSSDADWKQSYAYGGIQLRYRFVDDPPPPEPPPPPPPPLLVVETAPPPPEPEPIPATIASISTMPLEINETIITQTFPLLPYIFFDSGSVALRSRYVSSESTSSFNEAALPKQTLQIYYRMLDIVGKRMTQNATAKLTVTGTAHSSEGSQLISTGRARTVVDYLQERWNISLDRFEIKTTEKPDLASNERYTEGVEENRRVELTSNDGSLLGPIVHSRFNEYIPTQPHHDFRTFVRNQGNATRWNMHVAHAGKIVGQKSGTPVPPETISFDLSQEMTDQLGPVVGETDTLVANLNIAQRSGESVSATTSFPLRKTVSNYEVSRLSLIVFDYDRSDITEMNRTMMQRVISSAVRNGSVASVVGSTDRLGEMGHNMQLSTDRAKAIEKFTRIIAPSLKIDEVKGVGPSTLPYDNDLPEGRFYCRTVTLTITTPLR